MATSPETKIDEAKAAVAAEQAYAAAAAETEVKPADVKPVEVKPVVAFPAKTARTAAKAKPAAKKVAAKAAPKKAAAKKVATKTTAKPIAKAAKKAAKATPASKLKDAIMAQTKKTQTAAEDFTARVKDAFADAQDRAKVALEKGQEAFGEYGEFAKGNLEALVESGKILAAALQDMGKVAVEDGKTAFETMTADVKELAAVKSPADFFKLQGEILRRNFDNAVATGSKRSETIVKLANDAFAPIQGRVSLAIDKVKKAA